ncbi:hypothetical protein EVAR_28262_1 [Eumeta japonica]|uniref:Uncharacterized protein n=1 Tax=Eumeta variegata TaxID=151549 RepID=A0A4C1V5M7_EUMVA|nr:hypothetical protein EVAR_28262_1 [Eumeta japonica]
MTTIANAFPCVIQIEPSAGPPTPDAPAARFKREYNELNRTDDGQAPDEGRSSRPPTAPSPGHASIIKSYSPKPPVRLYSSRSSAQSHLIAVSF